MCGLTKKIVYADKTLAALLSVNEGALVSYAELSRGLHKYIKDNDLKNPKSVQVQPRTTPTPLTEPATVQVAICKDCGETIPTGAVFCDMCGIKQ